MLNQFWDQSSCALEHSSNTSNIGSFESLLLRIRAQLGFEFPNAAVVELPFVISRETQEALLHLESKQRIEVVEKMLLAAINKINHGSLETVDKLIRENMKENIAATSESPVVDVVDADVGIEGA